MSSYLWSTNETVEVETSTEPTNTEDVEKTYTFTRGDKTMWGVSVDGYVAGYVETEEEAQELVQNLVEHFRPNYNNMTTYVDVNLENNKTTIVGVQNMLLWVSYPVLKTIEYSKLNNLVTTVTETVTVSGNVVTGDKED